MTDEPDIQVFYSSEEMDLLKSRLAELEVQLAALKEGECAKEELDKLKIENSALANTIELARKDFNELQAENGRLRNVIKEIADCDSFFARMEIKKAALREVDGGKD